jgi:hypothetical protein
LIGSFFCIASGDLPCERREVGRRKLAAIARKWRDRPKMPGALRLQTQACDLYRFVHGKLVHLHWCPEQVRRDRLMKPDDPNPPM